MSILLGFALFALLFIVFAAVVIRLGTARARAVPTRDAAGPELSGLRVALEHNAPVAPLAQTLKPLVTVDPQFSSDNFLAHAVDSFTRVAVYDVSAPAPALPVTAGFAEHLAEEAQSWASGGFVPVVRDVSVDGATIEAVRIDAERQAIGVRLSGRWIHYFASSSGGSALEGSVHEAPFAQAATFVRPAGCTTAAHASIMAAQAVALSKCPRCGADVATGIAVCPYCATQLDQSGMPWLIDALTDAPLRGAAVRNASPRVSATLGMILSARQPGDRTSTTFAFGKNLRTAMEQICARDPQFSQERFLQWATQTYMAGRPAHDPVRKADPFAVIVTQTTQSIIVLFSSAAANGPPVVEAGVFSRPAGSVTPSAPDAAPNAVCQSCGAPLVKGVGACRSCGTPIPDTTGAWTLQQITSKGFDLA